MENVLVTGGAGFIGSHTVVELINCGYGVVVVDNLCNSCEESLNRVEKITGKSVKFYNADVRDKAALDKIFEENKIDWVIHFAGLKAVGESCAMPVEYYDNNLNGTLVLLQAMRSHGCKKIVFSSSATVYGDPEVLPLTEECKTGGTTNPYGTSKYFQEIMLNDVYKADKEWMVVLLRYFNPVGAHESGLIGEDPKGIPNNLTPYIAKVAIGELKEVGVFGDDYPTPDGSCIRDYIDVVDLARAHVAAVRRMIDGKNKEKYEIFNIGTGRGVSVLELVHRFEEANGVKINYKIVGRRAGDIIAIWADPTLANTELGWKAERSLDETLRAAWAWEKHLRNL